MKALTSTMSPTLSVPATTCEAATIMIAVTPTAMIAACPALRYASVCSDCTAARS